MLKTGVVSATFREKTVEEMIDLAKESGLDAIEWSGDIHVPHGNFNLAEKVGRQTRKAGLLTPSYASYYRAGQYKMPFRTVLDTAIALGAANIRVWAGEKGSGQADPAYIHAVYEDLKNITALAGQDGITVSVEYHANTLTDTPASTQALLAAVDDLYAYWQTSVGRTSAKELESLKELGERLTNVHVFYRQSTDFMPLAVGQGDWAQYTRYLARLPGDRFLFLEFVKGNEVRQFLQDAQTLKMLLGGGIT